MPPTFTPEQIKIINLFNRDIPEEDWREIRKIISKYFAEKAVKEADKVWDKKKWNAEDMERFLNTHKRTPYK